MYEGTDLKILDDILIRVERVSKVARVHASEAQEGVLAAGVVVAESG